MLFMDEVAEKLYFGQDSQNDSHYHKYLGMCPPKKGGHIGSTPEHVHIMLYCIPMAQWDYMPIP